uniref:CSON010831 protein n=1 Tax=Culicoides sonorensis TaxID=179676 RepID=A0A336M7X1_CULSO
MSSSGNDNNNTANLCRIGNNFYQGNILNKKTFGYGTLFDENYDQFIIGIFNENSLIDIKIAQFLIEPQIVCNIKKFNDHHIFDCEKENFIAQIGISLEKINISDDFKKIFKEICLQSKILKVYEDEISDKLLDFCENLEKIWLKIDWNASDVNNSLEFFNFNRLITQFTADNASTLIRKLGSTSVIFGDMSHRRAFINNEIVRRNQVFKFSNELFKFNVAQKLMMILSNVSMKYREIILSASCPSLKPHIESILHPQIFLIRICDLSRFHQAIQVAKHYNFPLDIKKVCDRINRFPLEREAIPIMMKTYPELLKALGEELTLMSKEVNVPFETLFEEINMDSKQIEYDCDTLNCHLRKIQLKFILELLEYYKPGEMMKKKQFNGPHEDYSTYSVCIKTKKVSFYDRSFKGKVFECIRIWYDLLDLNIVTIYQYKDKANNYLGSFEEYATLIFELFKIVVQGKLNQDFSFYTFVEVLTEIMLAISTRLCELSCRPMKSDQVKTALIVQIPDQNLVIENVIDIQKKINAILES